MRSAVVSFAVAAMILPAGGVLAGGDSHSEITLRLMTLVVRWPETGSGNEASTYRHLFIGEACGAMKGQAR